MSKTVTYITAEAQELDGSLVRNLERFIEWDKIVAKLSTKRKRAIVSHGWLSLKLHCWVHCEHELRASDINEIADIDGFALALLKEGVAELKENKAENEKLNDDDFLIIERFSAENITQKNKSVSDYQRQKRSRNARADSSNITLNRDSCHANNDNSINTIPNNTIQYDNPHSGDNTKQYNNPPSSYSSPYDKKGKTRNCRNGTNSNVRQSSRYGEESSNFQGSRYGGLYGDNKGSEPRYSLPPPNYDASPPNNTEDHADDIPF